jgi:hypothetical protein
MRFRGHVATGQYLLVQIEVMSSLISDTPLSLVQNRFQFLARDAAIICKVIDRFEKIGTAAALEVFALHAFKGAPNTLARFVNAVVGFGQLARFYSGTFPRFCCASCC